MNILVSQHAYAMDYFGDNIDYWNKIPEQKSVKIKPTEKRNKKDVDLHIQHDFRGRSRCFLKALVLFKCFFLKARFFGAF